MRKTIIPKHCHFSCYIEAKNTNGLLKNFIIESLLSLNGVLKNISLSVSNKTHEVSGVAQIFVTRIYSDSFEMKLSKSFEKNKESFLNILKEKIIFIEIKIKYCYLDTNVKKYCWSDHYILSIKIITDEIVNLNVSHIRGLRRIPIETLFNTFYYSLINLFRTNKIPLENVRVIRILG
ncbi:MAG: hypothetical protein NDF57_02510 [archaeon GBS-70-058]|nr:hypothetical protein [Candidatus Culexarchaeum nevadense]